MPSVSATVAIPLPVPVVYRYLQERYDREAHRTTSMATKGYVPTITTVETVQGRRLCFRVKGRDPLLRVFYGGWQWEYDLQAVGDRATQVTIRYCWSWVMSLLSAWAIRHQACNEIVETAMALDALAWDESPNKPLQQSGPA